MTTIINASPTNGLVQTADGSGLLKCQSNGVTTNALAWVNFAGASGTRNASYNVSSVTRNSAGNYTINFATALSDSNYAISIASAYYTAGNGLASVGEFWGGTRTASAIQIAMQNSAQSAYQDSPIVSLCVFGN